jgi:hypothetical protein
MWMLHTSRLVAIVKIVYCMKKPVDTRKRSIAKARRPSNIPRPLRQIAKDFAIDSIKHRARFDLSIDPFFAF